MIITRNELNKSKTKKFKFELIYESNELKDIYLRRLENIIVDLSFKYSLNDELIANVNVKGQMICPCAVTNEDVSLELDINEEILFNSEEELVYQFDNELDVKALVYTLISKEIPIKVVKTGKIEYPIGDGWQVITEEELAKQRQSKSDPRWAKLKDFKIDKED